MTTVKPRRVPEHPEYYHPPYTQPRMEGLKPVGQISVYRITTSDIHNFISKKVAKYRDGAKADVISQYTENKKGQHSASYAALMIGLSSEVIQESPAQMVYQRLIDDDDDVRIVRDIYAGIILRYQYDRQNLKSFLGNYRDLDKIHEKYGISNAYLKALYANSRPTRRTLSNNREAWIFFAANPILVISDMLTDIDIYEINDTGREAREALLPENRDGIIPEIFITEKGSPGSIEMEKVTKITDTECEYTVHVHGYRNKTAINPEIRRIMAGFDK